MTLQNLKTFFFNALSAIYPKTEIDSFFFLLTENKFGLKRVDLALNPHLEIEQKECAYFENALSRLKEQEPIQYIIGRTEFYSLPFKVNKNVLIPRPETEELVAWLLEEVRRLKSEVGSRKTESNVTLSGVEGSHPLTQNPTPQTLNILDIGTGSGCIAVALAKNLPNTTIWALDVSKNVLKTAQENAELNKVKINFIEADILKINVIANEVKQSLTDKEITTVASLLRKDEQNVIATPRTRGWQSLTNKDILLPKSRDVQNDNTVTSSAVEKSRDVQKDNVVIPTEHGTSDEESLPLKFDIIVSNPPYVRQLEKAQIKDNVLKHEPHLALFVADKNPLLFYDKIADFALQNLTQNGALYFEINQYLGEGLTTLLKEKGFKNTVLKQDIFGVDRMVKAVR